LPEFSPRFTQLTARESRKKIRIDVTDRPMLSRRRIFPATGAIARAGSPAATVRAD